MMAQMRPTSRPSPEIHESRHCTGQEMSDVYGITSVSVKEGKKNEEDENRHDSPAWAETSPGHGSPCARWSPTVHHSSRYLYDSEIFQKFFSCPFSIFSPPSFLTNFQLVGRYS